MAIFEFLPEILAQVMLLDDDEKTNPIVVLDDFFLHAEVQDYKAFLFAATEICIATDNEFIEALDRSNAMFHAKCIIRVIEAVKILVDNRKQNLDKCKREGQCF